MSGYVDIHAHVLPGIDDGPPDLEGAVAMVRAAAEAGTTRLAATPHLRSDFPDVHVEEIAARCAAVQERVDAEGLGVELICGAEVSLVWALDASPEDLKRASFGQRGTDLLIETPLTPIAGLEALLYQVRGRGYRITLAHPERGPDFQRNPSPLYDLVEQGILLQVNADALLSNARRSRAYRVGTQLCRDGLVHAIASDGHRATERRPVTRLAEAAEAAAALVGPARARWMMSDGPAAIVAGEEVPEPPAVARRRRRGLRPWLRR